MKEIEYASKSKPCPHCTNIKWCYFLGELTVCNKEHEPADGWRKTKEKDANGKYYYAPIDSTYKKGDDKATVIKTTYYEYPSRTGEKLVRSVRLDLSNGKKKTFQQSWTGTAWSNTTKHIDRSSIPIYKYEEIKLHIQAGKEIWFVEGESCAEAMWKIGLTATTNFGGSGRLRDSDLDDLEGANLIICPDRDTPGLKLADKVAQRFPTAPWLYAFPTHHQWNNIPPDNGADVKDWINDYKLDSKAIRLAVEDRRDLSNESQQLQAIGFSEQEKLSLEPIRNAIDGLIAEKKTESEKLAFLTMYASVIRWDAGKLKSYYLLRLKEQEEEDNKEETQTEIDQILESLNDDVSLESLVHPSLIADLEKLSDKLRYKHASILTAMLTAVSVLHKVGTTICLADDFYVSPNIYGLLVSPSGQGKSPMMKALVTAPFAEIEAEYQKEWEMQVEQYAVANAEYSLMSKDEQKKQLADYGLPTKPPSTPKILYATDLNTIAVAKQFRNHPEQGFMGSYDEARKLFDFRGGGRDNDESNLCSLYDGGGIKELRAGEDRASVASTNFGIYGAIQPRVLLDLMGEADDSQGKWARFLYTFQAKEAKVYDLTYSKVLNSLTSKLADFYRTITKLPKRTYMLTEDGQRALSVYLTDCTEKERMMHSDSILETFLGKAGSRVAKLAVNLHILQGGENLKTNLVSQSTVLDAINLDDYYTKQIKVLYSKSRANKGELVPKLVEILRIAQSSPSAISAREVARNSWIFKKDKEDSDQIRRYFQQLEEMGHGVCQGAGKNTRFKAN